MESLGSHSLGPLQFVDDAPTPCPSIGAARAVLGKQEGSAYGKYARTFKAAFNYETRKTDCLALLDSPPVQREDVDRDCPSVHRVLGILLDAELTFAPVLSRALAIGRSVFAEPCFAVETDGFGPLVASAQVLTRVGPAMFYGAAICAVA